MHSSGQKENHRKSLKNVSRLEYFFMGFSLSV